MRRIWAAFWLIGLIWGSSYMLISIGVKEVHPLHLVLLRVSIAAVGLWGVMLAMGKALPRDPRTLLSLIIIGIGNNIVPFLLITWGEQTVESGLTSVLQATAALFTLVIAHFAFADERVTRQKLIGLAFGFGGVMVLGARNWQGGEVIHSGIAGQLAIVVACFSYASTTVFSRRVIRNEVPPIVVAAVALTTATFGTAVLCLVGALFFNLPAPNPAIAPRGILALLTLGVVNTFGAYVLYYEIVRVLGAARASMITYVTPVVGLLLGVLLLGEALDSFIVIGAALIFTGIAVANLRYQAVQAWFLRQPAPQTGD